MKISSYILIGTVFFFHACGVDNSSETKGAEADSTATEESIDVDGHNSETSLDWEGTYSGILPCEDCDELQAEVTLRADGRYSRKLIYKGKSNTPLLSAGMFEWNEAGSEITLKSFKGNNQVFKVGENKLIYQLPEGVSGEFVLAKVKEKEEAV